MHGVLMRTPSSLDETWKRRVAASVLSSLTDARCQRYTIHASLLFSVLIIVLSISHYLYLSVCICVFLFHTA